MLIDIMGNELKEGDAVVTKVTEQVVGRLVKISEGGKIGRLQGNQVLDVPTEILILVEVRRMIAPGTNIVDVVKAYENKPNKPN